MFNGPTRKRNSHIVRVRGHREGFTAISGTVRPFATTRRRASYSLLLMNVASAGNTLRRTQRYLRTRNEGMGRVRLHLVSPFPIRRLHPCVRKTGGILVIRRSLATRLHRRFTVHFSYRSGLLSLLRCSNAPFLTSAVVGGSGRIV